MTTPRRTILVLTMALSARPLPAQVVPGDTVRLFEARTELVRGVLQRRDSSGLVVVDRRTRDTVHIPVFQITHAEVQRGSHPVGESAREIGTLAGVAVGIALVVPAFAFPARNEPAVGQAVSLLLAVGALGAGRLIGTAVSMTSAATWLPFEPAEVAYSNGDADGDTASNP